MKKQIQLRKQIFQRNFLHSHEIMDITGSSTTCFGLVTSVLTISIEAFV